MSHLKPCQLIAKDARILQAMLTERCGREGLLESLLREKLSTAKVVQPQEIAPGVVTLYSRVRYRVDGQAATTRIVIRDAAQEVVGATLPITIPRGLALLGLAEREMATFSAMTGVTETIHIEEIVYQPQAAGRLMAANRAATVPGPGDPIP